MSGRSEYFMFARKGKWKEMKGNKRNHKTTERNKTARKTNA